MAHSRIGHLLQFSTSSQTRGERGPVGINILAVKIPMDGWQGDIDVYAVYSDVLEWGLFGGGSSPINL